MDVSLAGRSPFSPFESQRDAWTSGLCFPVRNGWRLPPRVRTIAALDATDDHGGQLGISIGRGAQEVLLSVSSCLLGSTGVRRHISLSTSPCPMPEGTQDRPWKRPFVYSYFRPARSIGPSLFSVPSVRPLGKFSETGDQAENSIVVRHVDTAVFKMDNQALSLGLSGLW